MSRNPFCVYTAGNVEEADIVAAWLAEQDIEALVPDRHAIGATTFGLPAFVPGGVEVCVADQETMNRAVALLARHAEDVQASVEERQAEGNITVTCDECGETTTFSAVEAGSVAACPNCRAYLDVPDLSADVPDVGSD